MGIGCFLSPLGCASTTVAKATLGDVFTALTSWVLDSVSWLLRATGRVLNATGEPTSVVRAASREYSTLLAVAPVLLLIGLVVATIHGVVHGDPGSLWRVYLGVAPAAVLAIAIARPLAQLVLSATAELASGAAGTVARHVPLLAADTNAIAASTPGFGMFLVASAIVVGAWLLWCELVVRAVVLTLLIVLVPVIVPLVTIPAMRRVGWRLVETFLAVALSKVIVVVALAVGFDELSGGSLSAAVTGATTLVLATFSPFVLLRLVPLVEQSALHHVAGLRQRFTSSVQALPSSPAGAAVRALTPEPPLPPAPERPVDLGLPEWESEGDVPMPPQDGDPPKPPVGEPRLRGGHVAYYSDEMGPVVGWHFDE